VFSLLCPSDFCIYLVVQRNWSFLWAVANFLIKSSYESTAATWNKLSVKWSQRSLHKANESLLDQRKPRLGDSRLLRDGNSHVKQPPCPRYQLLIPRTWLIDNCVRLVASKTYLRKWSTRHELLNKFPLAIIEKSEYDIFRIYFVLACFIYFYIFRFLHLQLYIS